MALTEKNLQLIHALPKNGFHLAKSYTAVYGKNEKSARVLIARLMKKKFFRESLWSFIQSVDFKNYPPRFNEMASRIQSRILNWDIKAK